MPQFLFWMFLLLPSSVVWFPCYCQFIFRERHLNNIISDTILWSQSQTTFSRHTLFEQSCCIVILIADADMTVETSFTFSFCEVLEWVRSRRYRFLFKLRLYVISYCSWHMPNTNINWKVNILLCQCLVICRERETEGEFITASDLQQHELGWRIPVSATANLLS